MKKIPTEQIYKEIFSLSDIFDNMGSSLKQFNGVQIKMNSSRYHLFKEKGVACINCGITGTHFKLKKELTQDKGHFNLFTDSGRMMTKDHIIPRSLGGADTMINYQVMCCKCNKEKDASVSKSDLFKGQIKKGRWISEKQITIK